MLKVKQINDTTDFDVEELKDKLEAKLVKENVILEAKTNLFQMPIQDLAISSVKVKWRRVGDTKGVVPIAYITLEGKALVPFDSVPDIAEMLGWPDIEKQIEKGNNEK